MSFPILGDGNHLPLAFPRHLIAAQICQGRVHCDLKNLGMGEFRAGLGLGTVALVLCVGAGLRSRRHRRAEAEPPGAGLTPPPIAGLLLTAAVLGGLAISHRLPGALLAGSAALAAGGELHRRLRPTGPWSRVAAAAGLHAPGAAIVAFGTGLPVPIWARVVLWLAVTAGGPIVAATDAGTDARSLSLILLAVSAVGLYEAVPDPEQALVLLGATLPLLLTGWPLDLAGLGSAGAASTVGLFGWVAAIGGRGRLSAFVGGLACLGFLVTLPVARWWERRGGGRPRRLSPSWWARPLVAAVHLIPVYLASRVAATLGSQHSDFERPSVRVGEAASIAVLSLLLSAALAIGMRRLDWWWQPEDELSEPSTSPR